MKYICFYFSLALICFNYTEGQIVGTNAFMRNNYLECGVSQLGNFIADALPPAGYHPTPSTGAAKFGVVCDPYKNGWSVSGPGSYPSQMGDYFIYGSPEEGFGLEFNIGTTKYIYGNYNLGTYTNPPIIPGGVTGYNVTSTQKEIIWQGNVAGLSIKKTYIMPNDSLYILCVTELTNTTASTTFNDVYFSRNVDPDNETAYTGDYTTTNIIVHQQPALSDSRVLVKANGLYYNSYLGLCAVDSRARVCIGGFHNTVPSDLWNGVFGVFHTATGASVTGDIAMSLSFKFPSIPPGHTVHFTYAYVFADGQSESAFNNISPTFLANGKDITYQNKVVMGCNGINSVNLQIIGGSSIGLGAWNWTWSPATGLNTTVGTNVTATPAATTTYTVTATDGYGNVVYTKQIEVIVSTPVSISLPSYYTDCTIPVNLNATVSGGSPFVPSSYCGVSSLTCTGTPSTYSVGNGTVNLGTTGYPNPYGNYYPGCRHQFLILASELTSAGLTAGNIDRIEFNVISTNGVPHNNFTVQLGCTSISSMVAGFINSGLTTVVGPVTHTPVVGWNVHNFHTPYYWNGTDNLIVEVCFNNTSYTLNSPVYCQNTGFVSSVYNTSSMGSICTDNTVISTSVYRPNMRFRHCTVPTSAFYTYTYNWTPATGLSCTNCEDPTANPPYVPFTYTLIATDSNGCADTVSTTIVACYLTSQQDKDELNPFTIHKIFPNPVYGEELLVEFTLTQPHSVQFEIYDLAGRPIMRTAPQYFTQKQHVQKLNLSMLSNGTYLLTVKYGDKIKTERISIIR